uniref:Uncharacterized protein n=1 Tax=Ciona intestinalis TaxID=7719 RepID=H2XVE8_CIOIN
MTYVLLLSMLTNLIGVATSMIASINLYFTLILSRLLTHSTQVS